MPSTTPPDVILGALAVALRRDLLRRIGADAPITPKDLAAHLGLPLPNVSYHVNILRDAGLVEVVRTEPRRGAVAHFYRRTRKNAARIDEILALADKLR
jgi:DNA-binding transcriptional ArsR family regulator